MARCIRAEVPAEKDLQIPEEESSGHGKANTDESVVERCDFEISRDLPPLILTSLEQNSPVKGDQDTSATGIQIKLAYP
jgi:hypothetical protein